MVQKWRPQANTVVFYTERYFVVVKYDVPDRAPVNALITALQKLLQHNSDDPPDVRQFRPELNPRVAQLLVRMLAKRPSQRHQIERSGCDCRGLEPQREALPGVAVPPQCDRPSRRQGDVPSVGSRYERGM